MKEYKNKDIIVYWFPELCIHPGTCLRTLPEVFCLDRRPWIDVDAAEPEEIIKCIDKCPSGALRYSLPEGSKVDQKLECGIGYIDKKASSTAIKIRVVNNGPYIIEGPTEIVTADNRVMKTATRTALCACGRTSSLPLCDGSHNHK